MKPLTLHAHEVRRLLAAGSVTLWRPVKPQPESTVNCVDEWKDGRWELSIDHFDGTGEMVDAISCPHGAPGETRWCREKYTWIVLAENEYDANDPWQRRHPDGYPVGMVWSSDAGSEDYDVYWYSPVTMPRWASRADVRVTGVVLKRVEQLTDAEVSECLDSPLEYPSLQTWLWGVTVTLAKESE